MAHLSVAEIAEMARQIIQVRFADWLENTVFTWRWWLLLAVLIVPWIIWYRTTRKNHIINAVIFAMIMAVMAIFFDEFFYSLSCWTYPHDVIPVLPRLSSVDYTAIPLIFTVVYQHFSDWKRFFWVTIAVSTVASFVGEPLVVRGGMYVLVKWNYFYSWPIYIAMPICAKWLTELIVDIERRTINNRTGK